MRDVEIALIEPIEGTGNYVRVSVNDGWQNDSFLIDGIEVARAREEGTQAMLALIMDHAGLRTHDILSLSRQNGTDVFLDGKMVGHGPGGLTALDEGASPSR